MVRCYKLKSILLLSLLFTGAFTCNLKAIPFIGNIYGSVGGASLKVHEKGIIKDNIKEYWSQKNYCNDGVNLSLGIASDIHLPILRNLRLEANYFKSLNKEKHDLGGVGLYYDIKSLPIITPYVGMSILYYNTKINLQNKPNINTKLCKDLVSFNVGASASLPFFPIGVFVEYRYAVSGVLKNNIKINKDFLKYENKQLNVSNFIIGVRCYFF